MPAASRVKAAVVAVLEQMYTPAVISGYVQGVTELLVSYGQPGGDQPDIVIGVMGSRTEIERPTMGTGRSREETVEIDLIFSVWVPGDETGQQVATQAAEGLLTTFADYFRTKPNETLGGACRDAWVSSYQTVENVTVDPANKTDVTGRVTEIAAVLTAKVRL